MNLIPFTAASYKVELTSDQLTMFENMHEPAIKPFPILSCVLDLTKITRLMHIEASLFYFRLFQT